MKHARMLLHVTSIGLASPSHSSSVWVEANFQPMDRRNLGQRFEYQEMGHERMLSAKPLFHWSNERILSAKPSCC